LSIKEYAVLHKVSESTARNRLEAFVKEGKMKRVVSVRMLPNGGRTKTINYQEVESV
jgi:DeoR/GlpR family transcriptional regulator of sugar metabolism